MAEPLRDAAQVLAAARAGSPEALGQALEAFRGFLLLVADRELDADLRAKGGASDLVQETFLEAHKDFARFQGTTADELQAWLRVLLQHRLANFTRRFRAQKRAARQEVALAADDSAPPGAGGLAANTPTPSAAVVAREQSEAVEAAVRRLPEDYQRVLALRYQGQLSFEEVGARLGRSAEAVRKLWWRAIERLQAELDAGGQSDPGES